MRDGTRRDRRATVLTKLCRALLTAFGALFLMLGPSCGSDPQQPQSWADGSVFYIGWPGYADTSLAFSPTGNVLLFTAAHSGSPCVYGFDGISDPLRLTTSSYDESVGPNGCWHPEVGGWQGRIAYAAVRDDSTAEIRTIPGNLNSPKVALYDSLPHLHPSWTVDASGMVFATLDNGYWGLYTGVYDPETYLLDSIQVLYAPPANCLRPSYSPDGEWVLFQCDGAGTWDIWRVRADGSDAAQLVHTAGEEIHPCWSPDGMQVCYASDITGDFEIYTAALEGDSLVWRLTDNTAQDLFPVWHPDGGWIAFCSNRESGGDDFDIFTMDLE